MDTIGTGRAGNLKVPARITGVFWAIKLLSTAMGESLSDAVGARGLRPLREPIEPDLT